MHGSNSGRWALAGLGMAVAGCGSDDDVTELPETYAFESRFEAGESGVSYDGQVLRHVLIADLTKHIAGLTDAIDDGEYSELAEGDVVAELDYYLSFDSDTSGDDEIRLTAGDFPLAQSTYNDISSGKNLLEKLAGNDSTTDHRSWVTDFSGFSMASALAPEADVSTPSGLVRALFETLEDNALDRFENGPEGSRFAPDGETPLPVHVTEDGLDLQQLVQKFLLMGIAYSQGTDDYLDDDVDGKGLLADNDEADGNYSPLEHAWDEGFGYFGAARDYGAYTDAELAAQPYQDADDDEEIDLTREYSFGQSINASKRDNAALSPTDFSAEAYNSFIAGRALIREAGGALSEAQLAELKDHRDVAVLAWERAIAATIVHYINEVIADMGRIGSDDYAFLDHAKHFSELKGFALGLQFNPRSQLSEDQFSELHDLIGDAPVLETAESADLSDYRKDLIAARTLIGDACEFDDENLGDENGQGGW